MTRTLRFLWPVLGDPEACRISLKIAAVSAVSGALLTFWFALNEHRSGQLDAIQIVPIAVCATLLLAGGVRLWQQRGIAAYVSAMLWIALGFLPTSVPLSMAACIAIGLTMGVRGAYVLRRQHENDSVLPPNESLERSRER